MIPIAFETLPLCTRDFPTFFCTSVQFLVPAPAPYTHYLNHWPRCTGKSPSSRSPMPSSVGARRRAVISKGPPGSEEGDPGPLACGEGTGAELSRPLPPPMRTPSKCAGTFRYTGGRGWPPSTLCASAARPPIRTLMDLDQTIAVWRTKHKQIRPDREQQGPCTPVGWRRDGGPGYCFCTRLVSPEALPVPVGYG